MGSVVSRRSALRCRAESQKRLKSSQSSRSKQSLPPAESRAQTPASLFASKRPSLSDTDSDILGPGRIKSPLADLRPVVVAPSLPPMVPHAWAGDPDDPQFKAPSFETIGHWDASEEKGDLLSFQLEPELERSTTTARHCKNGKKAQYMAGKLKEKLGIQDRTGGAGGLDASFPALDGHIDGEDMAHFLYSNVCGWRQSAESVSCGEVTGKVESAGRVDGRSRKLSRMSAIGPRSASSSKQTSHVDHMTAEKEKHKHNFTQLGPLQTPTDPWQSSAFRSVGVDTGIEDSGIMRDVDFESAEDQHIATLKEMACVSERMEKTKDGVDRFAKVHFRWTVGIKFIGLVALASLLAVEWYSEVRSEASRLVTELSSLGKDVLLYDLVLTMSARMLALTGDLRWRDEYFLKVEPLEVVLSEIARKAPDIASEFDRRTIVANEKLLALEGEAIELSTNNVTLATSVLFSDEYETNKALLLEGLNVLDGMIKDVRKRHQDTQSWWGILSPAMVLLAFFGECAMTVAVERLDRRLERYWKEADHANSAYSQEARKRFVKKAEDTIMNIQGKIPKRFLRPLQLQAENDEAPPSPQLLRRRLFYLAMSAEVFALAGFAIPAVLTLVALYKAEGTDPLQQLIVHAKDTEFYDVALTSSARLCVLSDDTHWAREYDGFVAPIDTALAGLQEVAPDVAAEFAKSTSAANDALIDMEAAALEACGSDSQLGRSILFSPAYEGNKTLLLDGIRSVTAAADQQRQIFEDEEEQHHTISRILLIVSTFLIVAADLCTVVIAAWMEALSVADDGEDGKDSAAEQRFVMGLLDLVKMTLSSDEKRLTRAIADQDSFAEDCADLPDESGGVKCADGPPFGLPLGFEGFVCLELPQPKTAQIRIASYFRGHLTRTGRGDLVPKRRPEKEPLPPELAKRLARLDPWSEELNFRHACLGQTGTVHLAPFIKCLQSLQILELCGNYIGSKGIVPLIKMLETQWDLKYLGLAWNGLGDESCRHLASALAVCFLHEISSSHFRVREAIVDWQRGSATSGGRAGGTEMILHWPELAGPAC
ncbi:unnamed protein product [Symbiodinium sp. CCMP2456]|nr:unnamed protein product [Symbiodinium sp. CCMP2456]